ncbi:MAG TPA: nicotinate (nicotinamide) nucleotide adenylyltransferase [Spirochaeta sp.]|nr:nicotinate (nicotinamide) nucleotide adenylyltransferase [Spirochaeta sp.]
MLTKLDTVIIGGTFNPVHIGHLHLAEEVLRVFHPERILFVPSFISAHKRDERVTAAEHRIAMLKIACRDSEFEIETCEIARKGVSYSIDTIRFIRDKYKLVSRPGLVIGDDLVEGFDSWKNASVLAEETQIILACRNTGNIGFKYNHMKINNLMLDISSSDIRARIAEKRACRYLMPSGVWEYIDANNLYGDS